MKFVVLGIKYLQIGSDTFCDDVSQDIETSLA